MNFPNNLNEVGFWKIQSLEFMLKKSIRFDDSCSLKWNVMEIDEFYQKHFPIKGLPKAFPNRAITKSVLTQNEGKCSKK